LTQIKSAELYAMAVKPRTKGREWEITRTRGNTAFYIGTVEALDEKSAIEAAIKEYQITKPNDQMWLAARLRRRTVLMKWPWIVVWVFVALVVAGLVGIPLVHLVGWR
jgi:hypothetical protein